ncbi:sushi, von Willebrand factor type A, EGF and pentraxin domain-containing protein 1-like [Sycon ciliatum]|uniref:sushi, von Willebrand factor type A, EGF and pentraxin domain-containing protein 1-like n=1 Tax=Sycon ciliatum TaxID=27933 RepID=UPI0031F6EFAB
MIGWRGPQRKTRSQALDTAGNLRNLNVKLHPICAIDVKCNVPPIANGQASLREVLFTRPVTYTCIAGRRIEGDAAPTCKSDGTLTSVPRCIEFVCSPERLEFGMVNASVIKYLEVAKYSCQSGYVIVGNPLVTCNGYQSLSPVLSSCHSSVPFSNLIEHRYCQASQSIIASSRIPLLRDDARQLCRLYKGKLMTLRSKAGRCHLRRFALAIHSWLGGSTTYKDINEKDVRPSDKFFATCEIRKSTRTFVDSNS